MKIKLFTQAADLLGHSEIILEINSDLTVDEVMRQLSAKIGEPLKKIYDLENSLLCSGFFILLNGVHLARMQGTATSVKNDDVLAVVPVMEAG